MMETPVQRALRRGSAGMQRVQPAAWSFGNRTFPGGTSVIRPDDPEMLDAPEARMRVTVRTADVPNPAPKRGDSLFRVGTQRSHRILSAEADEESGDTIFILTKPE